MLVYNFKKEFIGIDEKELKTLGFNNLSELQMEVTDFADLFVKTPGYIHNFKDVHWIDYILCAELDQELKVIININNRNYQSNIQVTSAYFLDSPQSKSFIVHLHNLKELLNTESQIDEKVLEQESLLNNFKSNYIYNPTIASKTLGLDIERIEEFIQDFVIQAKEFQDNFYRAINEGDFKRVQILSHKLKGVAANLGIEDALSTLKLINTSSNLNEINDNLNIFYKIIEKLEVSEMDIKDSEVPDKIEVAELADDTFLAISTVEMLELDLEDGLDEEFLILR